MAAADSIPLPEGCLPVPGFPDYCVRPDGGVFSRFVYGSHSRRRGPWWQIQAKKRKGDRHLYVDLFSSTPGKPRRFFVHQLVMIAFVGPCPDGMEVLHKNGIAEDNRLANLRYGTRKENVADAIAHGDLPLGEDRPHARWSNRFVLAVRQAAEEGMSRPGIRRRFELTPREAYAIIRRKVYDRI